MHEVDMTKCLLISLNEWRQRRDDPSAMVETVHLEVGRFTCVEPDQLVTTYNPVPESAYRSPCCDHPLEEIVSGRELRIRSIDYRSAAGAALESGSIQRMR